VASLEVLASSKCLIRMRLEQHREPEWKELLGRQMNVNEARPRPAEKGDPGGKGPGEDPRGRRRQGPLLREPVFVRLTQGSCVQNCLSHDTFPSKKEARHQAEGIGAGVKSSISPKTFSTIPVCNLGVKIQDTRVQVLLKMHFTRTWNARPPEPF